MKYDNGLITIQTPSNMETSNDSNSPVSIEKFYCDEQARLYSFGPWINNDVNKTNLARAGFYYLSESDCVKCCFCHVVICVWSRGDNPFIEHIIHSSECRLLTKQNTDNVPIPETRHILLDELDQVTKYVGALKLIRKKRFVKLTPEIITATCRHPDYATESNRLESYSNWPTSMKQSPKELSDAGFFYLVAGDLVKCFYCGGCLRNFSHHDYALNEHKRHYWTRCRFIQFKYKNLKSSKYKLENRRPIKATVEQIEYLVMFMDQNDIIRKRGEYSNREKYNATWNELAKTLNDLDGACKDVPGWKEVWRNFKYNKKRKVRHRNEQDISKSNTASKTIGYIQSTQTANSIESVSSMEVSFDKLFTLNDTGKPVILDFTQLSSISSQEKTTSAASEHKQCDENPINLDTSMSSEIVQLRLKIDRLNLEKEKLQLQLEMNLKRLELLHKQQEILNRFNLFSKPLIINRL